MSYLECYIRENWLKYDSKIKDAAKWICIQK